MELELQSVRKCPKITLRGYQIKKIFWGSMPPDRPRILWSLATVGYDTISCLLSLKTLVMPLQYDNILIGLSNLIQFLHSLKNDDLLIK